MTKESLRKLQLGVLSLSAVALLAACGTDEMEEPPVDGDPAVEDPADSEEEPASGGVGEDEEEAN